MNNNNWRETIQSKSDQLNAVDLISPITVTVSQVTRVNDLSQPMVINYQGDNGKPYKPSLTMRRVILSIWGEDDTQWIGRGMVLYNEPTVMWAGKPSGGVQISHLSHMQNNVAKLMLPITRGKKKEFVIRLLS